MFNQVQLNYLVQLSNHYNCHGHYNFENHPEYNKCCHWNMFLIHDRKTINRTLFQVQDIKHLFLHLLKLYLSMNSSKPGSYIKLSVCLEYPVV